MKKAIFLDRDGTLVEDKGFVHKLEDFKLLDNVVDGLSLLSNRYKLFIITNQSGIGRGVYNVEDFEKFNERLLDELSKGGIKIGKVYFCPHKPEDNCECRKPKPKFLFEAKQDFGIDLENSYVVGDRPADTEMGNNAGCNTIHVLTGNGLEFIDKVESDYIAKDLLDASQWIIEKEKNSLFGAENFFPISKIKNMDDIEKTVINLKNQNKTIVTTNGVFDILHIGHIRYLQKAKGLGDILIVAVNSDASVKKIKGPKRPINSENDRAEALAALGCVDYAIIFGEVNPINILSIIKPDIHVKGGDYKINEIIEKEVVEKNNGKVILMKLEEGYSTTALIGRIKSL